MTGADRELVRKLRIYAPPFKRSIKFRLRKGRQPTWGWMQKFNNFLARTAHIRYPQNVQAAEIGRGM